MSRILKDEGDVENWQKMSGRASKMFKDFRFRNQSVVSSLCRLLPAAGQGLLGVAGRLCPCRRDERVRVAASCPVEGIYGLARGKMGKRSLANRVRGRVESSRSYA